MTLFGIDLGIFFKKKVQPPTIDKIPEITPKILNGRWTDDKNARICDNARHSDSQFLESERTVFGRNAEDLSYRHSDRLYVFDNKPEVIAFLNAPESDTPPRHTAAWYEKYLQVCFGQPVELVHIIAGYRRFDGFPYLEFGTRLPKAEETKEEAPGN